MLAILEQNLQLKHNSSNKKSNQILVFFYIKFTQYFSKKGSILCLNYQTKEIFKNLNLILKTVFYLTILLLFSLPANATDFLLTPPIEQAYSEIFKLKIQSGKEILAKENPNNPFKIYLENYIDLIELLNTENETAYENKLQKETERLKILESLDIKSPYNRLLRAEIKLHWALIKIRFNHEIKAGYNVVQAFKLLEENQKLFPDFLPNKKSLGMLHVLIGSVPENQKWITKIIGLRGNIQQGMAELAMSSQDKTWGLEAQFCSFFIKAYVLKFSEEDNKSMLQLIDKEKDNYNFALLAIAISLKNNRTEQAIQLIDKYPKKANFLYFPIMELYKAETLNFKSNYKQAIIYYQNYLKRFKGKTFLKDTYYKLFVCSYLLNDMREAELYLSKIDKVGNTIAESDKAAQKFYEYFEKTHQLPNKILLQLRLLFDGGYFEEGAKEIETLSEKSFATIKDKTEFNYRAGRFFQKLNKTTKAIIYFERAIVLNSNQEWAFAPNAALQLGYIYQESNQKIKAKAYFEKALAFKSHEYKNSVDNKARAALNELSNIR